MNNNIILAALQSQLETVKADARAHEENVYEPALANLNDRISLWFSNHVMPGLHKFTISSDRLTILPSNTTGYGNNIDIDYRGSWRNDGGYFTVSSYRPDLASNEDNTLSVFYYMALAAIANKFDFICTQFLNDWMPAINTLNKAKEEKYNAVYQIEREIRQIENKIKEAGIESFCQTGFECKLADNTTYKTNYEREVGDDKYFIMSEPQHINLHYGRGRWDYYSINSFKILNYPTTKHGKVSVEFDYNDKTAVREINKNRFADFISSVYNWQTQGAAERKEAIEEKIARWNQVPA